jgi:hypothetical protein
MSNSEQESNAGGSMKAVEGNFNRFVATRILCLETRFLCSVNGKTVHRSLCSVSTRSTNAVCLTLNHSLPSRGKQPRHHRLALRLSNPYYNTITFTNTLTIPLPSLSLVSLCEDRDKQGRLDRGDVVSGCRKFLGSIVESE